MEFLLLFCASAVPVLLQHRWPADSVLVLVIICQILQMRAGWDGVMRAASDTQATLMTQLLRILKPFLATCAEFRSCIRKYLEIIRMAVRRFRRVTNRSEESVSPGLDRYLLF